MADRIWSTIPGINALTSMTSPVPLVILTVKTAPAGLRSVLMIAIFRPLSYA